MQAVREIKKVKNHRVQIELPEDYEDTDVEIIVLPLIEGKVKMQKHIFPKSQTSVPKKTSMETILSLKVFRSEKSLNRNELKQLIEEGRA